MGIKKDRTKRPSQKDSRAKERGALPRTPEFIALVFLTE